MHQRVSAEIFKDELDKYLKSCFTSPRNFLKGSKSSLRNETMLLNLILVNFGFDLPCLSCPLWWRFCPKKQMLGHFANVLRSSVVKPKKKIWEMKSARWGEKLFLLLDQSPSQMCCGNSKCFFFPIYSLAHLVVAKLEELISWTLLGLFKIWLLFQDRVRSQNLRN